MQTTKSKVGQRMRDPSEFPAIGLGHLYARCVESDGCMLWNKRMTHGPAITLQGKSWKVRHLVWHATHPRAPAASQIPMPTVCGDERCICAEHLTLVKRNGHARGKKITLVHRANIAAAMRAGNGKVDMQQAAAIRASSDTLAVLAERHGIYISNAGRIRSHERWVDLGSPFAQLLLQGATA